MKKVQIPKKNTPTEYLVVRLQLVHVKKGFLGRLKDKILTAHAVIPNKPKDAVDLANQFSMFARKYGKTLNLE